MPPRKQSAKKSTPSTTGTKKAEVTTKPEDAELEVKVEALKTADSGKQSVTMPPRKQSAKKSTPSSTGTKKAEVTTKPEDAEVKVEALETADSGKQSVTMPPRKQSAKKSTPSSTGTKKAEVTTKPEDAEVKVEALETADSGKQSVTMPPRKQSAKKSTPSSTGTKKAEVTTKPEDAEVKVEALETADSGKQSVTMPPRKQSAKKSTPSSTGTKKAEVTAKPEDAEVKVEALETADSGKQSVTMPPRKQSAKKSTPSSTGTKKAEVTTKPEDAEVKVEALETADSGKQSVHKVDSHVTLSSVSVHKDYDCMLTQTNIDKKNNNNKYYVIQLLTGGAKYHLFTRWGRVGECLGNDTKTFGDEEAAIKEFNKKFKERRKNKWDDKANFSPEAGKYTLIDVEQVNEDEMAEIVQKLHALNMIDTEIITSPCTLDAATQQLIKLISDNNMSEEQMAKFEPDVEKMPLGVLSKQQIAKGFDVLEELQNALDRVLPLTKLKELSSKFYTVIPHSFGRKLPPTINSVEVLQKEKYMLLVLGDIEIAQSMLKEKPMGPKKEVPHPLDAQYALLKCGLEHVSPKSAEFTNIDSYVKATGQPKELMNVWKVDRHGEDQLFSAHKAIKNRRLLWHGTNVADLAAILKAGLRIMPHSGGRFGRGIYFASEHSKSAGDVGCTNKGVGFMFLNEVALGKEYQISSDDFSLREAPSGYDCFIAKGRQEPDPMKETSLTIDGNEIKVPQGEPVKQQNFMHSTFCQSEYLICKESQNRIRYLLQFKL